MDLLAAERLNGKLNKAKVWALACFVIAGALLIASLFMQPLAEQGPNKGAPGYTASVH
jgi:NhaP-type Na+/H+ or K+/H+ antiporter